MKEEFSLQGLMHQEAVRRQQAAEKDTMGEEVSTVQQGLQQVVEAVNELAKMITAPRQVVRDKTGRAVGVSINGAVRPIARGPDGRITGLQ